MIKIFVPIAVIIIVVIFVIKIILKNSVVPDAPENVTDNDILNTAKQGNKIQAIKWYGQLHGTNLKDSKDAVEEMIKSS